MFLSVLILTISAFAVVQARSYRTKSSDVYVHGYYRNGTYVSPYYRSAPNGIIWDNYSCIDDGKCGTSTSIPSSTSTYKSSSDCLSTEYWDTTCKSIPANATKDGLYSYNCNDNYIKNNNACIALPANAIKYGDYFWVCNTGYSADYVNNKCTSNEPQYTCPANSTYKTDGCYCNKNYAVSTLDPSKCVTYKQWCIEHGYKYYSSVKNQCSF